MKCLLCNSEGLKVSINRDSYMYIHLSNSMLYIDFEIDKTKGSSGLKFKYCPICGKKIERSDYNEYEKYISSHK